ncbi:MAG TPA: molybdopterin-dependent oxidoreductase [Burkholderiaceae bacterium]|nr:molybdopterin-dependent oxidoreductase [Burkholderiaceae bacterium]
MKISRVVSKCLLLLAIVATTAFANDDAILTVSGNIAKSNQPDGKSYVFSFDALRKLPNTTVQTQTTWTTVSDFSGPSIRDLLKAVGASPDAKTVDVKTFDNYPVTIPIADFLKWEVILAHSQDGKRLTLSTRGPLWIIYPVDKYKADLDNNATRSKFAWAVKGLVVR